MGIYIQDTQNEWSGILLPQVVDETGGRQRTKVNLNIKINELHHFLHTQKPSQSKFEIF